MVVLGAGFAGASFLENLPRSLRRPGETLLVDRRKSYPFIPLIHEVAVGRVHPKSTLSSIAALCEGRCDFLQAEVTSIDLQNRKLDTSSGEVGYEYLILAPGSGAAPPPQALGGGFQLFWTLEDALSLRASLNEAWQAATRSGGGAKSGALTVAIVGGGTTGVELAAEISVLFDFLKGRSSRKVRAEPRVVLLEAMDRLMGWLDPFFHEVAMEELAKLGVEVRLDTPVEAADEAGLQTGDERLPARIRIWAGGIDFSSPMTDLPVEKDASGRLEVDERLILPTHPEVYVLGDSGAYEDPRHGPLPPTASVAVQEGPYAARDVGRRLRGATRPPFSFFDRGYVVSLGPESAVAEAAGVKLRGPAAQALYRSIFLYYMKNRGRVLTSADWAVERTLGRLGFDARR